VKGFVLFGAGTDKPFCEKSSTHVGAISVPMVISTHLIVGFAALHQSQALTANVPRQISLLKSTQSLSKFCIHSEMLQQYS
jgi:hypothetical protein